MMHAIPTPIAAEPRRNALLAAVPPADMARWSQHLEPVELRAGQMLFDAGTRVTHLYFPVTAILALLNVMEDGGSAESSVVGREGLAGVSLFMGGESSADSTIVLCSGSALRIRAPFMMAEFNRGGPVLHLFLRYTQALITQMSQTVVCNRHHSVEQQLCRWLLLLLDRSNGSEILMTHETIANMLGVRREGITEAACRLAQLGYISYRRGHITVVNRAGLERRSCECYGVVRKEYHRLLPMASLPPRPLLSAVS
jgi:CRP-like cAMP-binding protein